GTCTTCTPYTLDRYKETYGCEGCVNFLHTKLHRATPRSRSCSFRGSRCSGSALANNQRTARILLAPVGAEATGRPSSETVASRLHCHTSRGPVCTLSPGTKTPVIRSFKIR